MPRSYTLTRSGYLLVARAAVTGLAGTKVVNLLVDTGSTFTILPVEVLESMGLSPAESKEHKRIATGSGYIIASKLRVRRFSTLGKNFSRFSVIAHTLPFGGPVDGLLGMDILVRLKATVAVAAGEIAVE